MKSAIRTAIQAWCEENFQLKPEYWVEATPKDDGTVRLCIVKRPATPMSGDTVMAEATVSMNCRVWEAFSALSGGKPTAEWSTVDLDG